MNEIKTNSVRYMSPENEGHRSFAEWLARFTKEEIAALFVEPADYSEVLTQEQTPAENMQREDVARKESYARSVIAENNYEMLSAKVLSLEGFESIQPPILNAEMKPIVKAALVMEAKRTRKIELFYKIETVDPDYLQEVIRESANRKKKVTFGDTPTVHLFKKSSPVSEDDPKLPSKVEECPPMDDGVKVSDEKPHSNETQKVASFTFKPAAQTLNVFECLQADAGEILKKTSPHGFNAVEKTVDVFRLKDSAGHYVDFFKDGSVKTSLYEVTDDAESVASEMLKPLLSILNVYVSLCEQKGLEAVLPKRKLLNPEFVGEKSTDNSEKIRGLIVKKLTHELLSAQYDTIRERVCFDGKKLLPSLPPKHKEEAQDPCSIRFSR